MASPEHAAKEIRAEAIKKMNSKDYQGAWKLLHEAKKVFPALKNIDTMLFVSNLLRTVDYVKSGFGVDWHQMLSLPPSAPLSITETRFNSFIANLEAIKDEFPCADIARGIMTTELLAISKGDRNKVHGSGSSQPPFQFMGTANVTRKSRSNRDLMGKQPFIECSNKIVRENANVAASKTNTSGDLKKKLPITECSSERVTRGRSSAEQFKTRGYAQVVLNKSLLGSKCQDLKMVKSENQTSDTTLTKLSIEKMDNGGNDECELNNNLADACWLANSEKLVTKASSCSDFNMEQSISDLKVCLFEAMPQNPHYKSLNGMSDEFRHPIIMGIETSFVIVAQQICQLFIAEDVNYTMDNITSQLIYLENMGYDVHKLRARLEELKEAKEKKEVLLKDCQRRENELKAWMVQREATESKNSRAKSWIAEQEKEVQRLEGSFAAKEHVIKFHEAREAEMEQRRIKWKEQCDRLDSEIEDTANLPW